MSDHIAQIQGIGVTLTAESDDDDGLALEQVNIGVPIENANRMADSSSCLLCVGRCGHLRM
jgi:hypothetical protein